MKEPFKGDVLGYRCLHEGHIGFFTDCMPSSL